MGYRTTTVEIELDEIDSEDLIDEFIDRFTRKYHGAFSDKEKREIIKKLQMSYLNIDTITISTLNDKMKIEFLKTVWDRLSPQELESKLA